MLTTSFDLSFDQTFQSLQIASSGVTADPCRKKGIYLMWLSPCGWAYYLFSGNTDTDVNVESAGRFEQGGVELDTLLTSKDVLTARAGNLTESTCQVLKTLFGSPKVFMLTANRSGKLAAIPVGKEVGNYAIWRESNSRFRMEIKLTLPKRKSQRV